MDIKRWIERLEEKLGAKAVCPSCGRGGPGQIVIRVHETGPYDGPENCPVCGGLLAFTLRLGEELLRVREEEGEGQGEAG